VCLLSDDDSTARTVGVHVRRAGNLAVTNRATGFRETRRVALASAVMWRKGLVTLLAALALLPALVTFGSAPADGAMPARVLLPDLDQEFPSDLRVIVAGPRSAPSYRLGFRSAVRNIGDGPLIISGHRSGGAPLMAADQLVQRSDGSRDVVAGVGLMQYVQSPDHQHWHYLGFDRYEIRAAGSATVIEHDGKTGFCLGDRYPVQTRKVPNALPKPLYVGRCGLGDTSLVTIEEGISVGWGDAYPAFIEFQDLALDDLPNGHYVLVHRVNADRRLHELSYANDAASILLDLHWSRGVPYLRVLASCPDSAQCDGTAVRKSTMGAHTSGSFVPDDPADGVLGGWAALQWNFAGPHGVDAPRAWENLIAAGDPGAAGVTVAVLDTGVSPSPDLAAARLEPGWDFVDEDPSPLDENGHGTHVASTIAEDTDNAFGLTGLAYGSRILPVRVLDRLGNGDARTIARGVVYAVDHGARVINLSANFEPAVSASQIPELLAAFDYASKHGVVVVSAAGNEGLRSVDYPARAAGVIAVGATTEFGCAATYSNYGPRLDLVAPGGGADAALAGDPNCRAGREGRPIYQVDPALQHLPWLPGGYVGTSMAAPHVAAVAALVLASRALGADPSPASVVARIEHTARDLGPAGRDPRYGWGLVDAGAATASAILAVGRAAHQ
jgi:serine protease